MSKVIASSVSGRPVVNNATADALANRPGILVDHVTLRRRTQAESSYDLKRNIFARLEGSYQKPAAKIVLNDVSLKAMPGEKIGIIGPNGSGKSTLLKVICGILRPTSGTVTVGGSIAPLIELGAGFDPDLSVRDNIILYGILLGFSKQTMISRVPAILDFAELKDYETMPVKTLSSGMNARLGFAIASDVDPDILVLDEVLSIGDEHFRNKCKARISRFWHAQTTVFVVSHDLAFIQESCSRVYCMQNGRITFQGLPKTVVRYYLDTVNEADRVWGVE